MTPEDSGSDIGCLGCLAMIITWPYYWFQIKFNGGSWG